MPTFTSDDEIASIYHRFIDRTLPKAEWTHAAHFAAALAMLADRSTIEVPRDLPPLIRAYNEATGVMNTDTGGYHETITLASIRAARSFLVANPSRPLFAICNALMASPFGASDWLMVYWSRSRLVSVEARRHWREPDLQPLPFP